MVVTNTTEKVTWASVTVVNPRGGGQPTASASRMKNGAVEVKLVKGQLALKDIALGQADLGLPLTRGAYLDMQNAVLEARREFLDPVDASCAKGIAVGIGPVTAFALGRGVLHETRHAMFARRRHLRIHHYRDHHVLERIAAEVPDLPNVIGQLPLSRWNA